MKKLSFFLIAALVLTTIGCEGPMGPQGPQGVQGVPGQNGINGVDGADGAIPNVYYFDIPLHNFIYESYNEAWNAYGYINGITIQITDLVLVYVNLSSDGNGDNYWQPLPYLEFFNNTGFFVQHSFGIMGIDDDTGNNNYLAGDLMFSLRASDGYAPYDDMSSDALLLYNVFIVQGQEGKKAVLPDNIDINDRDQVYQYLLKQNKASR